MRLLRGRMGDLEADQRRTREMADRVAETGDPALRVWTPHRQVAFGRRDRRSDGYDRATEIARDRGYDVTEREVGGRAVAFSGDDVAFALAEPVADHRRGIQERYDRVLEAVQEALADAGVDAERGEPAHSFCPGTHSLQVDGGKVVGVAQRVTQEVAVAAGVAVVDADAVCSVLEPVYDALGVAFDPASVGGLPSLGERDDPGRTMEGLRRAVSQGDR